MVTTTELFDALSAAPGKNAQWDATVTFNRTNAVPLDNTSVFKSWEDASQYALREYDVIAYPGQIIAVNEKEWTGSIEEKPEDSTLAEIPNFTVTRQPTSFKLEFSNGQTFTIDVEEGEDPKDISVFTLTCDEGKLTVPVNSELTGDCTIKFSEQDTQNVYVVDPNATGGIKKINGTGGGNASGSSADVQAETARAMAAEAGLQNNINQLQSNLAVAVTENSNPSDAGVLKTYTITQGTTPITTINIPKDFLVKSAEVKTCETADDPQAGYAVGDKYIDFVINTKDDDETESHVYLKVTDLVDVYTAGEDAAQVQLDIDENNVITASIVAGSIGTTELANSSVTMDKLANDVTATFDNLLTSNLDAAKAYADSKLSVLDLTANPANSGKFVKQVTQTDGQVSAAYAEILSSDIADFTTAVSGVVADISADMLSAFATDAELAALSGDLEELIDQTALSVETLSAGFEALSADVYEISTDVGQISVDVSEISAAQTSTKALLDQLSEKLQTLSSACISSITVGGEKLDVVDGNVELVIDWIDCGDSEAEEESPEA